MMGQLIVGIDEVGRGCVAGPIVACAVIIDTKIDGVKDSKLLSKNAREKLFSSLCSSSVDMGVGIIEPEYIDNFGLTKANRDVFEIALSKITTKYHRIITDGKFNFLKNRNNVETIIKADQKIYCVSVASIIAKVTRDRLMLDFDKIYPEYDFKNNVGYLTKKHLDAIRKFGLSPIHRKSINYRLI